MKFVLIINLFEFFCVYNYDEIPKSKCKFDIADVVCADDACRFRMKINDRVLTWYDGKGVAQKILLNLTITIGTEEKTHATCAGNWLFYSWCTRVLYLSLQGVLPLTWIVRDSIPRRDQLSPTTRNSKTQACLSYFGT